MSEQQKSNFDVVGLIVTNSESCLREMNQWQKENSEALDILNRFHDEHCCFSDEFRTF